METPRLVASDVDGTLLGLNERVSDRTAAVVSRVLATETPFVLVTGRPPRWVPIVAEQAGLQGYAVCANGAVLYDIGRDEVVWQQTLGPVELNDIAHALGTVLPGVTFATERVGDEPTFLAEHDYLHAWAENSARYSRAEVFGFPAVKMLVRLPGMHSSEMTEAATAVLGDEVTITYSTGNGLIEIARAGVTKATGLADVAARFGVEAADVIAFGDMPNDVPMLGWAGHGVAMANAHQDALDAADEVTASNEEDGVAQLLERWF
ncbi:HAD family hydrolase [Lentzea sp. NBRC 102530]|uniref:HAD family hydrolase n=1 Tax=Lentzea sp. NBRC 102530 TaxID=3032201 RepID=UPI0024A48713|nr:HAD family hydrolase [Lentzea sp. NBRC 102530]GLY48070.1 haloacid dehalogenase [Lentzea sp. NBRC 102530]